MPGEILTLSRSLKIVYEEARSSAVEFLNMFFPTVQTFDTAEIPMDRITHKNYLARYIDQGAAANVSSYNPGKGVIYTPPKIAESTPIDERLAQSVIAGMEANTPADARIVKLVSEIRADHDNWFTRVLVKQAMDIMTTGKFQPKGKDGVNIGPEEDYKRDPSTVISKDYSKSPLDQWKDAYDAYRTAGGPMTGLVTLVGENWLSAIEADKDFQAAVALQGVNAGYSRLIGDNKTISPIVEMKIPGKAARTTVITYHDYYEDQKTGKKIPFMDPNTIIMTSLYAPRSQIYAGIFLVDEVNKTGRVVEGQMVSDVLCSKNPDGYLLRSQSCPMLIPGNVNFFVSAKSTKNYE